MDSPKSIKNKLIQIMANTGYIIKHYTDTNVYSATYGQGKTERIYNTIDCPTGGGDTRNFKAKFLLNGADDEQLNCDTASNVVIENALDIIYTYQPSHLNEVYELYFGDCINTINSSANYEVFSRNYNVVKIDLGDSVTAIGENGLAGMTYVESVVWGSNITTIGKWAFHYNQRMIFTSIPEGVVSIGEGAFESTMWYNDNRSDLTLPSTLTSIGEKAFGHCGLSSVTLLATTPPTLDNYNAFQWSFEGDPYIIYVPDESLSLYASANEWRRLYNDDRIKGISEK